MSVAEAIAKMEADPACTVTRVGAIPTSVEIPTDPPGIICRPRQTPLVGHGVALELTLPIHTVSKNVLTREHGGRGRSARQRQTLYAALWRIAPSVPDWLPAPWSVTWTRLGGKRLDEGDGLPMAFAALRDALAVWLLQGKLGQMDDDSRIAWEYAQEPRTGPQGVRLRIEGGGA